MRSDETIEALLSGGHPNSLGRTVEVVELVYKDQSRLGDLYSCYFSSDPVVRLRVSSALKRVSKTRPEWLVPYIDGLLCEIADIEQASTQWTLAILYNELVSYMTQKQIVQAIQVMKQNLDSSDDWIVQNTTMQVLFEWSERYPDLRVWLVPRLEKFSGSHRKSVASRAKKLLARV